jgi:hypothetical protein
MAKILELCDRLMNNPFHQLTRRAFVPRRDHPLFLSNSVYGPKIPVLGIQGNNI